MKIPVVKKPSKLDALAEATRQDYSHASSAVVGSRRTVLTCEAEEIDKAIIGLQAALARARERRARVQAIIVGLGIVLERR